ncbi:MAG: ubiquinol-cytochrome c reductase iron-sulfur subunit [Planctomycetes bacterium]|nr:ubiquinol-cytochrome c reductase iron-sulfur subunit [Planctomycetota bacterium]
MSDSKPEDSKSEDPDRRSFLSKVSTLTMAGGLIAGYGAFAGMALRLLYPSHGRKVSWVFVGEAEKIRLNDAIRLQTPTGQAVTITRLKQDGTADDFLALSTTCPHLGCQVHWEPQHNRFFCPCHNGAFDPTGKATEGPPAAARQELAHFPLRIDNGLIFIQVPTEALG